MEFIYSSIHVYSFSTYLLTFPLCGKKLGAEYIGLNMIEKKNPCSQNLYSDEWLQKGYYSSSQIEITSVSRVYRRKITEEGGLPSSDLGFGKMSQQKVKKIISLPTSSEWRTKKLHSLCWKSKFIENFLPNLLLPW